MNSEKEQTTTYDGRELVYYRSGGRTREERPKAVVVTGGLGYIGQSLAFALVERGEVVVLVDRVRRQNGVAEAQLFRGGIEEITVWQSIYARYRPTVVYHCAGLISVEESTIRPGEYFHDNVVASLAMLEHLRALGLVPIIFSSSATVYGMADAMPLPESANLRPVSPYGTSKRQFEEILGAYGQAYGIPWIALRYFNVAGTVGGIAENHQPESHLLPRVAEAVHLGKSPVIYGNDYSTQDGTAIRDFIHVRDLIDVHLLASEYLLSGSESCVLNVGSGHGVSVWEMVRSFQPYSDTRIQPSWQGRRQGDLPILVADISGAERTLGWEPRLSWPPDRIVQDVWNAVAAKTEEAGTNGRNTP